MRDIQLVKELPFDLSVIAGSVKESSHKMYHRDFLAYLSFVHTKEEALSPHMLARWRVHMVANTRYSPSTINRMLTAVRTIMAYAAEQGYISYELADEFSRVRGIKQGTMEERKKPHARTRITSEQMERLTSAPDLFTNMGKRDAAILHTLATSGVRVSEAAQLTLERIGRENGEYYIEVMGKNDKDYRRAPLSPVAYQAIQVWLQARNTPCLFVFTSFTNSTQQSREKAMSSVALWKTVQQYAKVCGLSHIKPHDFRRFVGTIITKKHGIRKAQQILGHKKIDTTTNYDLNEMELGLTNTLYASQTGSEGSL